MADDEDEAFERELQAAPWAYGQQTDFSADVVLIRMRRAGLMREAQWLERLLEELNR